MTRNNAAPLDAGATMENSLFQHFSLGPLRLTNRVAVAPMTRVSATSDGRATPEMADYYAGFAAGGFGLIFTEGVYTDKAYAQGYLNQPGLTDADQVAAWRAVTDAVHAAGVPIIAQLMHAGALAQGNIHRADTIGPSAVRPVGKQMAFYGGEGAYLLPRSANLDDLAEVIAGFAAASVNAREAGFDGVEIHGANGYLLHQFLSEDANLRDDDYGGCTAARARLTAQVIAAVRRAVGPSYPLGVRVSQSKVNDFGHRWSGGVVDAETVFRACAEVGSDFIHTTQFEAWAPGFGEGTPTMAAMARAATGLPVIANGSLHDPGRARDLLASGDADLVSLGRGALGAADWPDRVRAGQSPEPYDAAVLQPRATLANADAWRRGRAETTS
ncbi:MAG: NADH:flavin oxidoreductase [Allosphingosinicella sp.]|uniref:NADH:flavin oxidoreductase n=1 Tax=Allosphingosinicella sp. TaxID=2823234 RepID=UPI00395112C6